MNKDLTDFIERMKKTYTLKIEQASTKKNDLLSQISKYNAEIKECNDLLAQLIEDEKKWKS
jgi:flagellar hook-associated protein FlgK